jgi:hypothetical protein
VAVYHFLLRKAPILWQKSSHQQLRLQMDKDLINALVAKLPVLRFLQSDPLIIYRQSSIIYTSSLL